METERNRARGQADDQRLPDHELRHQREPHPVMRARDAVLGVGDDEGGQREAADVKRHDRARLDERRQQSHQACEQQRDDRGHRKRHPAAARQEAAQQRVLAAGAILRDQFLRRRRDAEIHHAAEQQHPGPDVDIDAVIRAAHPAREQDLRQIGERRTDDADDENRAGQPPGQGGFAGTSQQRSQPRHHAGGRNGRGLSVCHGQVRKSVHAPHRGGDGRAYQLFVKIRWPRRSGARVKRANPEPARFPDVQLHI